MNKGIAFFDFDGTITTKDTLLEFIKFSKGKRRFYFGFLQNIFSLVGMKLKIFSNQAVKEKMLAHFFSGMPASVFENQCAAFYCQALPTLIRPAAIAEIKKLQELGIAVVVVSASPENWIAAWTNQMGVELIASRLEIKNEMITGKIIGKNCHGIEKVARIKEKYALSNYAVVYAYGDSSGDLPMLELANDKFFKPFRKSIKVGVVANPDAKN